MAGPGTGDKAGPSRVIISADSVGGGGDLVAAPSPRTGYDDRPGMGGGRPLVAPTTNGFAGCRRHPASLSLSLSLSLIN